ncbi:OmpA family protein [Sphingomonas sp. PAMC 26605]|uniref:OmpA family protein n=1 Tax=Sphingomonas sp. PAMC 26605 TaxID=1112214 RepID=UPI00026CAD35|nr:OmpA family protein [Sphingomonas sp. PAMC 26605]
MADNDGKRTDGAPPTHIHIEKKKKTNWLAWLLLALGVLAALLALSRCNHRETTETRTTTTSNTVVAETPTAQKSAALAATSGLGAFLAGSQPTPQTFVFEKLNFETAKSDIRASDQADVNDVAAVLQKYPNTNIRIAGYADTRGSEAANVVLGKARADSVKAALVAKGVEGSRIETATGGDKDPVDTNGTASGRAENRRIELVVTKR